MRTKKATYVLSKDNYTEVMNFINEFFSKKTKSVTKSRIPVATNIIHTDYGDFEIHGYKKGFIKTIYIGNCHIHPMSEEKHSISEPPILAVSDKYSLSCLPMYFGTKVSISRDSLYIERKLSDVGLNNRFEKFIHEDYTDSELISEINQKLSHSIYEYLTEDYMDFDDVPFYPYRSRLMSLRGDIAVALADKIKGSEKIVKSVTFSDYVMVEDDHDTIVNAKIDFSDYVDNIGSIKEEYSATINNELITSNNLDDFCWKLLDIDKIFNNDQYEDDYPLFIDDMDFND